MDQEEEKGFLEEDDFDNFGFQLESDFVQKFAEHLPNPLKDYLSQGSSQQRKIKFGVLVGVGLCVVLVLLIFTIASIAIIAAAAGGSDSSSDSSSSDDGTIKPPVIPSQWESTVSFTVTVEDQEILNSTGYMWNDNAAKLSRLDFITYPTADRNYYNNITQILNVQTNWILDNGICRRYSSSYSNLFSFLSYHPSYLGQEEVEGFDELCDKWETNVNTGRWNQTYNFVFCNSTPFLLVETAVSEVYNYSYSQSIYFSDFVNTTISASIFKTPPACLSNGFLCTAHSPYQDTIEMYLFHDSNTTSLANQNTADVIGAAALLCDRLAGQLVENNLITVMNVLVNTTWGQYGNCEEGRNSCNGANNLSVGRAASFRVKPSEGQCDPNLDTGSWFSLTEGGACGLNQPLGEDGCVWKPMNLKTTFTADCLVSKGFLDACASDPFFPFASASTILQEAVLSCPLTVPE